MLANKCSEKRKNTLDGNKCSCYDLTGNRTHVCHNGEQGGEVGKMRYLPQRAKTRGTINRDDRKDGKKRFHLSSLIGCVAFIVMLLVIGVVSSNVVLSIANAMKYTNEGEYDLIEVTVMPGDTLWGIAKDYSGPEVDLRVVVDKIMRERSHRQHRPPRASPEGSNPSCLYTVIKGACRPIRPVVFCRRS